jgi:hypothetical protein
MAKAKKDYKVVWRIEVDKSAKSPVEAAKIALAYIRDSASLAHVFEVDGKIVDLDYEIINE